MPDPPRRTFRFAIDRGGTFTDVYATIDADDVAADGRRPPRREVVVKLLSEDPSNYPDAPREGIRRVLESETGIPHPRDRPLDTSRIAAIRMGTTVATNALLERRGERCALLATKGFGDLLRIGNQARPNIFDLRVRTPGVLPEEFVEVDECVTLPLLNYNKRGGGGGGGAGGGDDTTTTTNDDDDGSRAHFSPQGAARAGLDLELAARADAQALAEAKAEAARAGIDPALVRFVECSTGETALVRRPPDLAAARRDLERLLARGFRSVAVAFKHAAVFPDHELAVGALARELGFAQVSLSHAVARAVRLVPRAHTAAADAYLTPAIARYVSAFTAGFDAGIGDGGVDVQFMQSDGGLAPAARFSGHLAILSGPAGGYVGYARTTKWGRRDSRVIGSGAGGKGPGPKPSTITKPSPDQVIGFDMGGTSTDVSRFALATGFEHVHEAVTAGVTLSAPQLDINTVAAGGGSLLRFEHGMLAVGPGSAGAHPGPACYRKRGGLAAVTDANVVLGRLQPDFFPRIFGASENEPLDVEASRRALAEILEEVNADAAVRGRDPIPSVDELALGFVAVAVEAMCRPIRALTQAKGHDAAAHSLAVFGGAGAQHACGVARALGMRTAFVHRHAGVLSAVGIAAADVAVEAREPAAEVLPAAEEEGKEGKEEEEKEVGASSGASGRLRAKLDALQSRAEAQLRAQGFESPSSISSERFLNLRYEGTDVAVMVPVQAASADSSSLSSPPSSSNLDLDLAAVSRAFERAYRREFGFVLEGRAVVVDDVRVRCVGKQQLAAASFAEEEEKDEDGDEIELLEEKPLPAPAATVSACFSSGGRQDTPVFELSALSRGQGVPGPALLSAGTCTIVVEPRARAVVVQGGSVRIDLFDDADLFDDDGKTESASTALAVGSSPSSPPSHSPSSSPSPPDPVRLALFSHRFMGIAEQMGRVLARTAVSVNIKERLDFSCALFSGEDGSLVANAPHLPVHLGAMSEAVRYQVRHWCGSGGGGKGSGGGERASGDAGVDPGEEEEGLFPGDVLCSNHPQLAGGSHLPDITVITPVFEESDDDGGDEGEGTDDMRGSKRKKSPIFFVASRGHHADVGGATPGSMPPHSTSLSEEGAAIVSFKLVRRGGVFDEAGISRILKEAGTRALSDNLSDLRAQVAANARGISLVKALIREHGRGTVLGYMGHIQRNAEGAVRAMLRKFAAETAEKQERAKKQERAGRPPPSSSEEEKNPPSDSNKIVVVRALDRMDDGTPISLRVSVDRDSGSAEFDFAGTGPQVRGNANAPPAVTSSAVIYSLRAMVDADIPLNQGCLAPVKIRIPPRSILSPSAGAAVVGGNVLTSQRVTDVVLKAFGAAAASQGCMNNFTFGDEALGYYETVAGGSGAGPGWHGASGVQTHMTNTRITDPEVLERRLPVALREFSLRRGSGGRGQFRGGDGVVREVEFLRPLTACLLSERRSLAPFGLEGGGDAQRGVNLLITREKKKRVGGGGEEEEEEGEEEGGEQAFSSSSSSAQSSLSRELVINLGGKATVEVETGDRIRILTPGGGGFGKEGEGEEGEGGEEDEERGALTLPSSAGAAAAVPRASGSVHAYAQAQETA